MSRDQGGGQHQTWAAASSSVDQNLAVLSLKTHRKCLSEPKQCLVVAYKRYVLSFFIVFCIDQNFYINKLHIYKQTKYSHYFFRGEVVGDLRVGGRTPRPPATAPGGRSLVL